jgi:hypothetical protein
MHSYLVYQTLNILFVLVSGLGFSYDKTYQGQENVVDPN